MRHLRVLVSEKANSLSDCTRRNAASTSREVILPLCSSLASGLLSAVLGLSVQKRHGPTESSKQQATNMIKVLEHVTYKNGLRKLRLRRFRGILSVFINTSRLGIKNRK